MVRWQVMMMVWALVGCGSLAEDPSSGGEPAARETPEKSRFFRAAIEGEPGGPPLYAKTPVAKDEVGDSGLLPPPKERTRLRMNLDQLQANISKVTGGMTWVDNYGKNLWEGRKSALGVPDYMGAVTETLEPTLLFVKLLGDAARDICPKLLAQEVNTAPEQRIFLMEAGPDDTYAEAPAKIEANLSRLVLRFHGRYFKPGDPRLAPWVTLFANGVTATGDSLATWTAVCVALISHPDFASY